MARGTKRRRKDDGDASERALGPSRCGSPVRRDLLQLCYPHVQTLRDYVLCRLPASSRLRRRKIASLGQRQDASEAESNLARVLDSALVCSSERPPDQNGGDAYQQFLSFSQQGDESHVTLSEGISASAGAQCEIVDFVIWLLFKREKRATAWPKHLLCNGFRQRARDGDPAIPDIYSLRPNSHAAALKQAPWPHLLALLGRSGQRLMVDLLVGCSIFMPVEAGLGNYYQLSGVPLFELELPASAITLRRNSETAARRPSDITLVRSRTFYAKPALTPRGRIQVGYKHIHVLNRCAHVQPSHSSAEILSEEQLKAAAERNELNTAKVLMYIFPRQFRLHNVFTSNIDAQKTTQKFSDYASREEELATRLKSVDGSGKVQLPRLPKRLRGAAKHLVQRLQILHGRCSYTETLRHYCPTYLDGPPKPRRASSRRGAPSGCKPGCPQPLTGRPERSARNSDLPYQATPLPSKNCSLVGLACPSSHVSAFCQAVLSKIIPNGFWGDGDTLSHNKAAVLRKVDHFIKLRRFESMTLHEISQGLKVADLAWLRPPGQDGPRLCQTDMAKRLEIFHEFLYYVFDSLLIPLINGNFYVTESNMHRYQTFYFRHDVWRLVAEPATAGLKTSMFEEVKLVDAPRLLESRRLGFGQMRLLPKGDKLRPIMNLRRRQPGRASKVLGPSINSMLRPVHAVLELEKNANPLRLGSTIFSVGDMYQRVKRFKDDALGARRKRLYFAKVDVRTAFDTIPQRAVVELMATVLGKGHYTITKHAEIRPGERALLEPSKTATKAVKQWRATALTAGQYRPFLERLESELALKRRYTVFIDGFTQRSHDAASLLGLLTEHVESNLVRFGKKLYRQKTGIPQGSVLSSLLCNYFYADLEMRHLSFLDSPDSLLMRLIDDFLLITLDKSKAVEFVQTMHRGFPDHGVEVNPDKTLVNFDLLLDGDAIRRVEGGSGFPYCGALIDCQSLGITKDRGRGDEMPISNSLTVEFCRCPGQNFQRKMLNAFKIQSHLMFYDTSHNSTSTVLQSFHGAFCETGRKMWAYIRCLPRRKRPSTSLIIQTISKIADVAFLVLSSKSRKLRYPQYTCNIRKGQVTRIAYAAFWEVLSRKQTGYGQVVEWLQKQDPELRRVK